MDFFPHEIWIRTCRRLDIYILGYCAKYGPQEPKSADFVRKNIIPNRRHQINKKILIIVPKKKGKSSQHFSKDMRCFQN